MATFPPPPPFVPATPPDPFTPVVSPGEPALTTPLPPPLVGEGSPWAPINGENRDRILDWWRSWFRNVFFPWIAAWTAWWDAQWVRLAAYLNAWLASVDARIQALATYVNTWITTVDTYIEEHAVNGHSWWKTVTPINPTGTTVVEIAPLDEFRPLLVGDLVSDTSTNIVYGVISALVDATHAQVTPIGTLRGARGLMGFGWWPTATSISPTGTTPVVLAVDPDRVPQVGDFVVDDSTTVYYGAIVSVTDVTHVVVAVIGHLQGSPGIAALGAYDFTTPALPPRGTTGDTYQGEMVPMPQMVGAFVLTSDHPAWVRVYASEAYMLADAARDILTPLTIADDHGCYLDFVATLAELSKTLTPGIMLTDVGSGLWLSILNTSIVDTVPVAVHFDYRTFRE